MNPGLRAVEGPAPKAFSEQETRSLDRDIQINRLCKPANPAFTISKMTNMRGHFGVLTHVRNTDIPSRTLAFVWLACRAEARGISPSSPDGLRRGSLLSLRRRRLVEPIGIEPTTSSLQSSRSPN